MTMMPLPLSFAMGGEGGGGGGGRISHSNLPEDRPAPRRRNYFYFKLYSLVADA